MFVSLALACVLFLDFAQDDPRLKLVNGARRVDGALEFTTAMQYAELQFSQQLGGAKAASIGGWFFPRRTGEQHFMFRGVPETGPLGERFFRPTNTWVNFVLGTDQRGFLMGAINGNGSMPFVHVTANEVQFDAWNQLVLTKDTNGFQRFYINGAFVHTDTNAIAAGKIWPFNDTAAGEPLRLAMPLGGRIGEVWICARELEAGDIKADFLQKRARYKPALPGQSVRLGEMNAHPLSAPPRSREQILEGARKILGTFPTNVVALDPKIISDEDCGRYERRKVSIQVQPNDRMPAWMLIPKNLKGRAPAIICFYGTTSGAGKDTTVGLSGRAPETRPHPKLSFAIDMVEAGFVAFAPDYLRDGGHTTQPTSTKNSRIGRFTAKIFGTHHVRLITCKRWISSMLRASGWLVILMAGTAPFSRPLWNRVLRSQSRMDLCRTSGITVCIGRCRRELAIANRCPR